MAGNRKALVPACPFPFGLRIGDLPARAQVRQLLIIVKISLFFLRTTLLMLLLMSLSFAIWKFGALTASYPAISSAIFISFVSTLLAYTLTYMGLEKATGQFATLLLSGIVVKMLVGLIAPLVVALVFKPVVVEFVIAYFISYFIFTAFEVYGLMRKLRPD